MRGLLCAVLLSLCWPVLCLAQQQSLPSTDSPPAALAPSLPQPVPSWDQLDEIWDQLEQSGRTLRADSARLKTALELAQQQLTTLSLQLADSLTQVSALSCSLEQAEQSLSASERLLKEAQALAQRQGLELWVWRGATVVAVVVACMAIVR